MNINRRLNIKVSYNEAKIIQNMLDKGLSKPMVKKNFQTIDGFFYVCPVCGKYISESDNYCRECGQKIDNKNIAL